MNVQKLTVTREEHRERSTRFLAEINMSRKLRSSVLYIFGGKVDVNTPKAFEVKMDYTSMGLRGSKGVPASSMRSVLFEDIGHLIAMEALERTANYAFE